ALFYLLAVRKHTSQTYFSTKLKLLISIFQDWVTETGSSSLDAMAMLCLFCEKEIAEDQNVWDHMAVLNNAIIGGNGNIIQIIGCNPETITAVSTALNKNLLRVNETDDNSTQTDNRGSPAQTDGSSASKRARTTGCPCILIQRYGSLLQALCNSPVSCIELHSRKKHEPILLSMCNSISYSSQVT
ncbi:unnamed protein product, partial [Larinioides sclopetarius]